MEQEKKEGDYLMMKETIQQKDIAIINLHAYVLSCFSHV